MRILVTERIGQAGLEVLRGIGQVDVKIGLSADELRDIIDGYEALVVRSKTKVVEGLIDAAESLRVIGRAGTGVDNIDVEAATRRGIFVVNAPSGNSNAVAEHTIALMLALARHVWPAICSLKAGRWEKSSLQGFEVKGKNLGLVGLGRIGSLVASKAEALEMNVGAFDPYVSSERAASSGVELMSLDELLGWADFLSVHTPLLPQTRGMIGREELARLKPSAYVVNCARGGIVDEQALKVALEEGQIAGAALDVFEVEPTVDNALIALPNVIVTPHLGALTAEAQEKVARDVAMAIVDVLSGRMPSTPVNMPYLPPKAAEYLKPYSDLAQRMGSFFIQWRGGLAGKIELSFGGEICDHDTRVLTAAFLAGLLGPVSGEPVNIVNAPHLAEQRGLVISEVRKGRQGPSMITASFPEMADSNIMGNVLQGEPHLVRLDGQRLGCVLAGMMLVDLHIDRPGIVGRMGLILGDADINISFVQMSRASRGGASIMILGLDSEVSNELMPQFSAVPNVQRVRRVTLPPLSGAADEAS